VDDSAFERAAEQVRGARQASPVVREFFDEPSFTFTYVVHDPASKRGAIIDSVLDFDPASGRTATDAADSVIAYVAKTD